MAYKILSNVEATSNKTELDLGRPISRVRSHNFSVLVCPEAVEINEDADHSVSLAAGEKPAKKLSSLTR